MAFYIAKVLNLANIITYKYKFEITPILKSKQENCNTGSLNHSFRRERKKTHRKISLIFFMHVYFDY